MTFGAGFGCAEKHVLHLVQGKQFTVRYKGGKAAFCAESAFSIQLQTEISLCLNSPAITKRHFIKRTISAVTPFNIKDALSGFSHAVGFCL